MVGSFRLTKEMSVSIESACRPVPLFFPDRRIVSQMLPGSWSS